MTEINIPKPEIRRRLTIDEANRLLHNGYARPGFFSDDPTFVIVLGHVLGNVNYKRTILGGKGYCLLSSPEDIAQKGLTVSETCSIDSMVGEGVPRQDRKSGVYIAVPKQN